MLAVIVTAVVTYVVILILNLDVIDFGNFLVEGLIAVVVGAGAGLIVPWYRARQRRQERRG